MADYILLIGSLLLTGTLLTLAWRQLAGAPRTLGRAVLRASSTLLLSLILVGALVYGLTRARTFQLAGGLVSRVNVNDKVIALTFDDGPTPEYTEEVLTILDRHDVPATFYLTGAECTQNPGQLRQIVGQGHELGNHTYSHGRFWFQPKSSMVEEIEHTEEIFRSAGYQGTTTFRPPGCKKLLAGPLYLRGTGRTTVTWDLEPDSIADIANDADAMTAYVAENARPGSIVLMHVMYDSRDASREALPQIIDRLTAQGYSFVTVSQLLKM